MTRCVVCGKENESLICGECRKSADIEKLCGQISAYTPEKENGNSLWDEISLTLKNKYNLRNIAFALADELPSPKKEFWKIITIAGAKNEVPKDSRKWLYEIAPYCFDSGLPVIDRNRIRGILLTALWQDYEYEKAEEQAEILSAENELYVRTMMQSGEYYTVTRRYEKAERTFSAALARSKSEADIAYINRKLEQIEKHKGGEKKGYLPNPSEDKENVIKRYIDFLASFGITVEYKSAKKKGEQDSIPDNEYPQINITWDSGFKSFVAFDFETTGVSTSLDEITEIGAIKVVDGNVVESESFTFRELVCKRGKSMSAEAREKTGITDEMRKDARRIEEVFPDFMEFVGDNILVGFNNASFDNAFLRKGGRYSHIIIENSTFDVRTYAMNILKKQGYNEGFSLEALAERFDIVNPNAHRALSDAITTAKLYLKLLEIEGENVSSDDDDIENW